MPNQSHGKFACRPFDNFNLAANSDGRRHWMVTRKRSNAEEIKPKLETTVIDSSIKLCSDCRTSNTPLWRSGPDGPMSLCNACGIRYRKRKRSEKTEGDEVRKVIESKSDSKSCQKQTMGLSEEELRRRQREKQEKILMALLRHRREVMSWRRRWFQSPSAAAAGGGGGGGGGESDEVAEAALLLLSLSLGISVHS